MKNQSRITFSRLFFGQCFPLNQPQSKMRLLLLLAAICGLLASLMSSAIGHAHLLFRLSRDGLLPSWLGQFGSDVSTLNHHQPVQLPVRCLVCGCVFSLLAAHLLSAVSLLRMLGVGTLLNFLCVSLALLWLRYDFPEQLPLEHSQQPLTSSNSRCEPSACCDCCCACVGRLGSAARLCLLHDNHKVQPVVALQGSFYFERERLRRASGGPFKRSISDCLLQQQRLQKSYVGPADYGTCAAVSCACNHFAATAAATTVAVDSHDHRPSAGTYTSCNSLESITEEIDLRTSIKRRTRNDLCRQICVKYENHSVVSLLGFEFALNNQLPTSRSARKVKSTFFSSLPRLAQFCSNFNSIHPQSSCSLWSLWCWPPDWPPVKPSIWCQCVKFGLWKFFHCFSVWSFAYSSFGSQVNRDMRMEGEMLCLASLYFRSVPCGCTCIWCFACPPQPG